MAIKTYTKIEDQGMVDPPLPQGGATGEYGYGQYVNAYVIDTEYQFEDVADSGEMGLYATERVPFDASDKRISKASKLACQRARRRYIAEMSD